MLKPKRNVARIKLSDFDKLNKKNKEHHNRIINAFSVRALAKQKAALLKKRRAHLVQLKKIPAFKRILSKSRIITIAGKKFTLFTNGFKIRGAGDTVLLLDDKLRGIVLCRRGMTQLEWEPLTLSTIQTQKYGSIKTPRTMEVNPSKVYEGKHGEIFTELAIELERIHRELNFSAETGPEFVNMLKQFV
jgi:hypothetical protein